MWASLPVLFRRYGCLEWINQDPVEGTVGMMGDKVRRIQMNAGAGNFKMEEKADEALRQEELERRRQYATCPSQLMFDSFAKDKLANKHECRWGGKDWAARTRISTLHIAGSGAGPLTLGAPPLAREGVGRDEDLDLVHRRIGAAKETMVTSAARRGRLGLCGGRRKPSGRGGTAAGPGGPWAR
mmetsp:Transcript_31930/g.95368  ORF Transcript_31930/g.95368 Transcript_31930/m.95368 type:complete len:184 (-) Transcript_31930:42-593(-)